MFVIGCNTKAPCKSTYFGGKIINPKSDYVVLYKNIMPLDTFFLDKNNSFNSQLCFFSKNGIMYYNNDPDSDNE